MEDLITVNIKLDFPDFYRFQLRHFKKRFSFLIYIMIFYVLITLYSIFSGTVNWYKDPVDFLPFSFLIIVPTFVIASVYFSSKKYFANDPFIQKEHHWIISNSGFENSSENSNIKMAWAEVYKFIISKKDVTIYCSPVKAFILPKRFFSEEELNKLENILRSNVISKEKNGFFSKGRILRFTFYLVIIIITIYATLNNLNHKDRYFNAGIAKEKTGDYEGAINDFNNAIKEDPDNARAFYHRGCLRGELGDYEGQQYDCKKAIEIDKNFAAAYLVRGYAKYQLNDSTEACEDLHKAKELGDHNAEEAIKEYCK